MKELFIYLLKSGVYLMLFLAVYELFLRRQSFFGFNRVYLLCGILLSLLLPAVNISRTVTVTLPTQTQVQVQAQTQAQVQTQVPATLPASLNDTNVLQTQAAQAQAKQAISPWLLVGVVYFAVIAVMIIHNAALYSRLMRIIRSGQRTRHRGYSIVESELVEAPLSIGGYILINSATPASERAMIIAHEREHIRRRHLFDLLLANITLLMQWFNPAMWIYVSRLRENHEFAADHAVVASLEERSVYSAALLNYNFGGEIISLTTPFATTNLINRITMMTRKKSSPLRRAAVLALVPLLGISVWLIACTNTYLYEFESTPEEVTVPVVERNYPIVIIDGEEVSYHRFITHHDPITTETYMILQPNAAIREFGERGKYGAVIITTATAPYIIYNMMRNGSGDHPLIVIDGVEIPYHKYLSDFDRSTTEQFLYMRQNSAMLDFGWAGFYGAIVITTKKG